MAEDRRCSQCGVSIAPDSQKRICPECETVNEMGYKRLEWALNPDSGKAVKPSAEW